VKLHNFASEDRVVKVLAFHCPGCGFDHVFTVGPMDNKGGPRWEWNGSVEHPEFHPSLLINGHDAATRCHLFMKHGAIQFCPDSFHELAGKTVEIPDWESA